MKHKNKTKLTALDVECPFLNALKSHQPIDFVPEGLSKTDLALLHKTVGSRTLPRLRAYLLRHYRGDGICFEILTWYEIRELLRNSIEPVKPEVQATPKKNGALLSAKETAALLNVSRAHLYQMGADGRLGPKNVNLGRRIFWRKDELTAWIKAECPVRVDWLRRK